MSEDPAPDLLSDPGPNPVQSPSPGPVHGRSSPAAKIALFRSLFRGRDDVYSRRFESSKTGKAGYQPACGHEWVPGLCEKPRVKCSACRHRRFLPVTDEVVRWHLSGQDDLGRPFVMGIWKKDYAGSVRRLIRDGVDPPLAGLFGHVASAPTPEAEGADRARSATEAVLFRRRESLPATAGRFRLNADLAISFDGAGRMEVDLLCAEARLAIELDGAQHLADAEAYRRDRRKDALLQEHGYFVLRFLAEDVGKHLDEVLDAILRALAHHRSDRP